MGTNYAEPTDAYINPNNDYLTISTAAMANNTSYSLIITIIYE